MSQYILLIRTADTPNTVIDPYCLRTAETIAADTAPVTIYALTTSNRPPTGLALLQNYCPVRLAIIHTIAAGNQTEYLERTLKIKFHNRLLHSFWYAFSLDDIAFLQSLNERNFSSMIGFIHRQLKKPEMDQNQGEQYVKDLLQKAEQALK